MWPGIALPVQLFFWNYHFTYIQIIFILPLCTFHIHICDDYQRHILVLRKDKDTIFITDSIRTHGRKGQRVLGKLVSTFSIHTAIDIKKESVINVVCYERVCCERVCYEHGLSWKWSVLNKSVMNGFVMNVVCFEWSVMSGLLWTVCFEWEPFWSMVMFLWVTSFKRFAVIGFRLKYPSYWRWWWQLHMLQQFWPQK